MLEEENVRPDTPLGPLGGGGGGPSPRVGKRKGARPVSLGRLSQGRAGRRLESQWDPFLEVLILLLPVKPRLASLAPDFCREGAGGFQSLASSPELTGTARCRIQEPYIRQGSAEILPKAGRI